MWESFHNGGACQGGGRIAEMLPRRPPWMRPPLPLAAAMDAPPAAPGACRGLRGTRPRRNQIWHKRMKMSMRPRWLSARARVTESLLRHSSCSGPGGHRRWPGRERLMREAFARGTPGPSCLSRRRPRSGLFPERRPEECERASRESTFRRSLPFKINFKIFTKPDSHVCLMAARPLQC